MNRWATRFAPAEAMLVARLFGKVDELDTIDRGVVPAPLEPDDTGPLRFDYSVQSSERIDPVALVHQGAEWAVPLLARPVAGRQDGSLDLPALSFFAPDQPNVVLQTIKRADFGDRSDVVLRLREVAGRETAAVRLLTPMRIRSARLATLAEAPLPSELETDPLTVAIRPYETLTIRARLSRR